MTSKKVLSRRRFLKLAGAGSAITTLAACAAPRQMVEESVATPTESAVAVQKEVLQETKVAQATPSGPKPEWISAKWFDPPQPSDYPYDDTSQKHKIRLLFFSYYGDAMRGPDKDFVHAWLNKYFNVELDPIAERDVFQKLQLMVAAGDIPDLVSGLNRIQMIEMVDQGVLVDDLKPIVEQYMPNYFNKLLEKDWSKVSDALSKGKLIALAPPPGPSVNEGMYVRKTWLDKLGLSEPKTTDDLFNVMVAFREQDPDGNNKKDTYGILFWVPEWIKDRNPYGDFGAFSGLFGAPPGYFITDDSKLSCGFWLPGRKAWVEYMKKLSDAGVLPEDWLSQDAAKFYGERIKRNDYGLLPIHPWNMYTGKYSQDPEDAPNFALIAELEGPGGKKVGWQSQPMLTWNFSQQLTQDEGKLKRVARMMDEFSLNSGKPARVCSNLWGWGIEDFPLGELVRVQILDDWTYQLDIKGIDEWHNTKAKEMGLGLSMHEWMGLSWGRWYPQMYLENKAEVYIIGGFRSDQYYMPWEYALSRRPAYKQANITPEANLTADLDKHRVENELRFITGRRSLDEWDAYVREQLDRIGGRKVLEEGLKQLQENLEPVTGIDPAIPL